MSADPTLVKPGVYQRVKKAVPTAILLVGLAYILSLVMTAPFAFTASFLNSSKPSDFDFSDFYNAVADGHPVRDLDDRVVIVNLENSDRAEFALTFQELAAATPAAVGVDVLFQEPHDPETDAWLIASLRALPNVVMAESLIKLEGKESFRVSDSSFFADTIGENIVFAASNLPSRIASGTVRSFRPEYPTETIPVPGFAAALAAKASPAAARSLRDRNNELENINYPSREITILTPAELSNNPEVVNGKVVILGAVSKTEDIHPTPIEANMPGILIHAYAVSTILHNNYLNRPGSWVEWTIACLLCFIITLGFCVIPVEYKGLTLRLTQMVLLLLVIYAGYYLFVEKRLIIDFSPALLMITFGLFACDLRLGIVSIFKKLRERSKRKRQSKIKITPANQSI